MDTNTRLFLQATLLQATPGWNWQKFSQMLSNSLRLNFPYLKIIHILHPSYHLEIIGYVIKNKQKNNFVSKMKMMKMKMKMKMKNKSHRYDINRPRSRHEHKYTEDKKCLTIMMVICVKQHLSNIGSSIHEKVKQHWGWVTKKPLLIKKACTSSLAKISGFPFLITMVFFEINTSFSKSFAITFEIISHKKVLCFIVW